MRERLAPFLILLEARYAPLLFAVAPQAYAVYLWLFPSPYDATGEIFAVLGALGYELVYVGAIAWAEEDRTSFWTWTTATAALVFSVLVAYHVYEAQEGWAWLHAGFPLVAFAYTLNMYSKRSASVPVAPALNGHATGASEPLKHLAIIEPTASYLCPHCSEPLKSKQARGAAAANGYCPACKAERKIT